MVVKSTHRPKQKRRRMEKLRVDEVSMVDTPAQAPARVAIMKRAADAPPVDAVQKKLAVTTMTAGHAHTIIMVQANADRLADLRAGQTSFADDHVHDWVQDDAGNIAIAEARGHSHGLAVLVMKTSDEVDDETLAKGVLAALGQPEIPASDPKAAEGGAETNNMTPEEKAAFAKAAQDKLDAVQKQLDRSTSICKLTPDQRVHFDGLKGDEAQDEFLSKTSDEQDAVVKNEQDANGVVYTDRKGREFRKNDDPRLVEMARDADEDAAELAKEKAITKRQDLLKRSGDVLKNCKGTDEAKAALLGAVEGIQDADLQKSALEILKSKDAGIGKALEVLGTSDDGDGEGSDAEASILAIAKKFQESDSNLTAEQAYSKALNTPEGTKLALSMRS